MKTASRRPASFVVTGSSIEGGDVTYLLDKDLPQYNAFITNGSAACDNIDASPVGRVVTVGCRAKF